MLEIQQIFCGVFDRIRLENTEGKTKEREMVRRIIEIDEAKCNGCGACADACHEGAIGMVDGKAKLLRDDYCDGLGDCLPTCPTGAIRFVEREAAAYDEAAVLAAQAKKKAATPCGCPGSAAKVLERQVKKEAAVSATAVESQLRQWPVQIKLAPVKAPYFDGAKLLIAADCSAYAYANFHQDFIKDHITLIGCPKLDAVDYSEKLTEILRENAFRSVTVVRMVVPCCGGIEQAVRNALAKSGKCIPWSVATIGTNGEIIDRV
jgi:ferredoxin